MTQNPAKDDELLFAAEQPRTGQEAESVTDALAPWKVLVVDDDETVHAVTRLVLADLRFEGRKLQLLEACSAAEARSLLAGHPDAAVILLDVVMEQDDSGLALVRHIREELDNRTIRIVLRTGVPGMAPPSRVVLDYDINDYAEKSDLTAQRLVTIMVSSLRAYRDITACILLADRLRHEVAEKEKVEAKLRRSDEMYSAIFSHVGIGITLINPEMEIVFMNPIMKAINPHIDISQRPLCYKSFNTPPRDQVCSYCPVVKTLADGQVHTAVTETPSPEGIRNYRVIATPVFAPDGTVSGAIEVVEDITERRKSQDELNQKETYLQGILEATADGILAVDTEARIIMANKRFVELWNVPPETLAQGGADPLAAFLLTQLQDGDTLPAHFRKLNGAPGQLKGAMRLIDGRIFEFFSAPLVREDTVLGRVWLFCDVTDKKKMEEEIVKAQKLESVGLLAGGIAHDFNNLLTVVLGNLSLANALPQDENRKTGLLVEAEKAALRARELTQQLLTFARGGAPVRRSIPVTDMLRETAGFALSGSKCRCDFDIAPELPPAEIDEGQISQVIHNLILNADQSMPSGGTIRISCQVAELAADQVPPLPAGRYLRIRIQDQGMGVPAEHLPRIFDPYFTTKEKGRGLGLASVYSIIRNHDGQITVSSLVGAGTTFTIYLPVTETAPAPKPAEREGFEPGWGRILVMDDEEAILEIAGKILAHLGFEAVFARHGEEAVRLYREALAAGQRFRATICDLTIPGGLGGLDTVHRLHALDPQARVIVSSGYSNDPIMSAYRQHGFAGVIVKPYLIEDMAGVLAEVLGGQRQHHS